MVDSPCRRTWFAFDVRHRQDLTRGTRFREIYLYGVICTGKATRR